MNLSTMSAGAMRDELKRETEGRYLAVAFYLEPTNHISED